MGRNSVHTNTVFHVMSTEQELAGVVFDTAMAI